MRIRDERPGEAPAISAIQYAAFKGHPLQAPGAEPFEPLIVERLRAARALALSLVAEVDGAPVGHTALSRCDVGLDLEGWFLLGPLGVLPRCQGQGLGSALVRESLNRVRALGARGVVLVGDLGFYSRFGFENVPGLSHPGILDQYVLAAVFHGSVPQGDIMAHAAFHFPNG